MSPLDRRYGHAEGSTSLPPVALRMLRYFAAVVGGAYPQSKAVEMRTLDVLTRGGYVKLVHPNGIEITAKGHAEIAAREAI